MLMNQSSRDHTLLDVRPSPGPGRGAVSRQSSRDKRRKRSLPGSTVRKEGSAISGLANETLCGGLCGGLVLLIAAAYVAGTRRRPPRHGTIQLRRPRRRRKG